MARITIQVLEGFERGRVYSELITPVTIGREEDNTIQLNDERVSRFHVKIQEDAGRVILADLDSTNGTRINGHPVQMRVLQHGDQMSIGRSLLLYGSPAEIDEMLKMRGLPVGAADEADSVRPPGGRTVASSSPEECDYELRQSAEVDDERQELFPHGPPDLPGDLRIAQMAQLSDVLAYLHEQIAQIAEQALEHRVGETTEMRVNSATWQRLLRLEMQLARYLRQVADPHV